MNIKLALIRSPPLGPDVRQLGFARPAAGWTSVSVHALCSRPCALRAGSPRIAPPAPVVVANPYRAVGYWREESR